MHQKGVTREKIFVSRRLVIEWGVQKKMSKKWTPRNGSSVIFVTTIDTPKSHHIYLCNGWHHWRGVVNVVLLLPQLICGLQGSL